jgi:heme A synthase
MNRKLEQSTTVAWALFGCGLLIQVVGLVGGLTLTLSEDEPATGLAIVIATTGVFYALVIAALNTAPGDVRELEVERLDIRLERIESRLEAARAVLHEQLEVQRETNRLLAERLDSEDPG